MRTEDRIIDLRVNEHAAGYGIYNMLLELLRDADGYKVKYKPTHLAFAINEQDVELITRVINNYGLFEIDKDGYLSSPWLTSSMSALEDKKRKYAEAGKKGAAKKWQSTNDDNAQNDDGNAMATPQNTNGDAMTTPKNANGNIYNKYNITNKQTNKTDKLSWRVNDDIEINMQLLDDICREHKNMTMTKEMVLYAYPKDNEHNTECVYEIAYYFGLSDNQLKCLMLITQNGKVGGRELVELIKTYRKAVDDKFVPKYPFSYILSQFSSYANVKK